MVENDKSNGNTDRQRDRREEGGERISFIFELTPLRSAFKER